MLGGTPTATPDASGTASFSDLSIGGLVGVRTLSFTAGQAPPAVSGDIDVTPGPATQLGILVQPATTAPDDQPFTQQPVLQLLDAWGNGVNQAGVSIVASKHTGPGMLRGTRNVKTDAAGFARYSDLEVDKSGIYMLRFDAAGLTTVFSASFVVP
jgi:hypothetical protein